MAARVLVCDDEAALREMLNVLLRRSGYDVVTAGTKADAFEQLADRGPFDAVITDLALPDGSGMDLLSHVRAADDSVQVLVITAYGGTDDAVEAMRRGAYDFVAKPFRNQELLAVLEKALEKRQIVGENRALRASLEAGGERGQLIGRSEPMRKLIQMIERIADARTSVLITGESGTGKEVVARAIHERGARRDAPFVVVNCGALPSALIESELFGSEKGAFTGATTKRDGLIRAAHEGTLFLDEIGELPLEMQVKLLRVLQDRRVRPIGGSYEVDVDIRVMAATNREIEDEVEAGAFRQDLFYRLNVIRLHLPPLRERPSDIPLLARHLLQKHAAFADRTLALSDEAMRWLSAQPFLGNVRELENVIERAVTLARKSEIGVEDFPDPAPRISRPSLGAGAAALVAGDGFDLDAHLGGVERELILAALDQTAGNRTEAARRLGMTFRSFRYRLRKYGLAEPGDENRPSDPET